MSRRFFDAFFHQCDRGHDHARTALVNRTPYHGDNRRDIPGGAEDNLGYRTALPVQEIDDRQSVLFPGVLPDVGRNSNDPNFLLIRTFADEDRSAGSVTYPSRKAT